MRSESAMTGMALLSQGRLGNDRLKGPFTSSLHVLECVFNPYRRVPTAVIIHVCVVLCWQHCGHPSPSSHSTSGVVALVAALCGGWSRAASQVHALSNMFTTGVCAVGVAGPGI